MMNPIEIIEKKRDGGQLDPGEIKAMIQHYTEGRIPDYQMSAMLMAIYFQGMDLDELIPLTDAMVHSGEIINLSDLEGVKVDKHSTGGVGDKVSLVLAPLVAACGVPVPMMAGRGLGHTGGTLDKLEAISGFRTQLSQKAFRGQIRKLGLAILGQTHEICPADRKMYALRDATGTVPSIPLICSSIISKKKAEGADALVLDVKMGEGAFFRDRGKGRELAQALVRLGNRFGLRTVALLTAMDEPLGKAVGNWLETQEAIFALQGKGPADLMTVVLGLGGIMLFLGGKTGSIEAGVKMMERALKSGDGFDRFRKMVSAQNGDVSLVDQPEKYPASSHTVEVVSSEKGYVASLDARETGFLAMSLGAGRFRKEDAVDYRAGIVFHKKTGDAIQKGESLATLYTDNKNMAETGRQRLLNAFRFSSGKIEKPPVIEAYIDESGREMPFPVSL